MTGRELLYLTQAEVVALSSVGSGPDVGVFRLDLLLDDEGGPAALDPDSRDALGRYPRWIILRLGILRDFDLTSMELTDEERATLRVFAAEHGKELVG